MFRFIIIILFSSFIFPSHELFYFSDGAIPSYTKTPNPGKVNIEEYIEFSNVKKEYVSTSKKSLGGREYDLSNYGISIDYYGLHAAGFKFDHQSSNIDYKRLDYTGALDLNGTSPGNDEYIDTPDGTIDQYDIKSSRYQAGFYYVWNDFRKGYDLHQYTFSILRIRQGVLRGGYEVEINNESETYGAALSHTALDFIVGKKALWGIDLKLQLSADKEDAGFFTEHYKTNIIYHFTPKISAAAEFANYIYSRKSDFAVDSQGTFLNLSAGYKLEDITMGYLDFDLKIHPFISQQLSGKNTHELNSYGINFSTHFR